MNAELICMLHIFYAASFYTVLCIQIQIFHYQISLINKRQNVCNIYFLCACWINHLTLIFNLRLDTPQLISKPTTIWNFNMTQFKRYTHTLCVCGVCACVSACLCVCIWRVAWKMQMKYAWYMANYSFAHSCEILSDFNRFIIYRELR